MRYIAKGEKTALQNGHRQSVPRPSSPKKKRKNSPQFPPYPEGTKFNEWLLRRDLDRNGNRVFRVRRWLTVPGHGSVNESYPLERYLDFRHDEKRLQDFVITLNNKLPEAERAKKKIEIRHAWINDDIIREFLVEVRGENTTDKRAMGIEHYLRQYFLNWFMNCLDVSDMNRWFRYQRIWGYALINRLDRIEWSSGATCPEHIRTQMDLEILRLWPQNHVVSYHTVKMITQGANRFLTFLSVHYPEKMDMFLALNPLSPAQLKALKAETDIRTQKRKWFIPDADWTKIAQKIAGTEFEGPIHLCYCFGLRRNESLGVKLEDVTEDGLVIERQLIKWKVRHEPEYGLTKGRSARTVEFRFVPEASGPEVPYRLIKNMKAPRYCPSRFSKFWAVLMKELNMPYRLHDLRRTWITRCFRNKDIAIDKIRQNAGHVEIQTTEGYRIDERKLLKKSWVPRDADTTEND